MLVRTAVLFDSGFRWPMGLAGKRTRELKLSIRLRLDSGEAFLSLEQVFYSITIVNFHQSNRLHHNNELARDGLFSPFSQ